MTDSKMTSLINMASLMKKLRIYEFLKIVLEGALGTPFIMGASRKNKRREAAFVFPRPPNEKAMRNAHEGPRKRQLSSMG